MVSSPSTQHRTSDALGQGNHRNPGLRQRCTELPHRLCRSGIIPMNTNGVRLKRDNFPCYGLYHTFGDHAQGTFGNRRLIVEHSTLHSARGQGAVWEIGPVCEHFTGHPEPSLLPRLQKAAARQAQRMMSLSTSATPSAMASARAGSFPAML